MTLDTLDRRVTESLRASGFADLVLTKTGHGLGLDVHEAPQVMIGNMQAMEPGMVFTIEPGLYREGDIGVRIEDDVLVTPDGADSLTSFDRALTLIGVRRAVVYLCGRHFGRTPALGAGRTFAARL